MTFWPIWLTVGVVMHLAVAVCGRREQMGPWGYPEPRPVTWVAIAAALAWWMLTVGAVIGRWMR